MIAPKPRFRLLRLQRFRPDHGQHGSYLLAGRISTDKRASVYRIDQLSDGLKLAGNGDERSMRHSTVFLSYRKSFSSRTFRAFRKYPSSSSRSTIPSLYCRLVVQTARSEKRKGLWFQRSP